jgi:hypothetical protein
MSWGEIDQSDARRKSPHVFGIGLWRSDREMINFGLPPNFTANFFPPIEHERGFPPTPTDDTAVAT